MQTLKIHTNKKLLPVSIALALGTLSANAYAIQITATADYTIGSTGPTNDTKSLDTATSTATNIDILAGATDDTFSGNSIFYHTYGSTDKTFGARVSGTGVYDISSSITYVDTIFNDTGTEQAYSFDFMVEQGGISVYGIPTATQFAYADYDIEIFFNGALVFSTFSALTLDASGTTFSGDELLGGAYTGGNSYSWSDYFGSAALGTLADGETATLEYSMTTKARGNIAAAVTAEPVTVCEGFGGGEAECWVETGAIVGGSTSRSGDPYNIYGHGAGTQFSLVSTATGTASVPEASSLFLMGIGLAGLGFGYRKKFKLS